MDEQSKGFGPDPDQLRQHRSRAVQEPSVLKRSMPANRPEAPPTAEAANASPQQATTADRPGKAKHVSALRVVPVLVTLLAVSIASLLGWAVWDAYLIAPWTRDGTVRAYVLTEAAEVSGRLVNLPVRADEFVHKGQLLIEIEHTDYAIAVASGEANVEQAQAALDNARAEATRRADLTTLSTSIEEKQSYATTVRTDDASLKHALADLAQARVNLQRTRIVSPVNGFVTNLTAQPGDYISVGERVISLINSDSYWLDGYFEETQLASIRVGDIARVYLMGYKVPLWGHVDGIARGIETPNAQPDGTGLAEVNPTFTWIRLAQRVPVRIAIDRVPAGVVLVAGMTATIQINPHDGDFATVLRSLAPWRAAAPPTATLPRRPD